MQISPKWLLSSHVCWLDIGAGESPTSCEEGQSVSPIWEGYPGSRAPSLLSPGVRLGHPVLPASHDTDSSPQPQQQEKPPAEKWLQGVLPKSHHLVSSSKGPSEAGTVWRMVTLPNSRDTVDTELNALNGSTAWYVNSISVKLLKIVFKKIWR